MKRHDPRHDPDGSSPHRGCDSFSSEDGLVLYDPDNEDAWLRSDTTLDPEVLA